MRLTKRYEHYDIIDLTARTNTNCSVICHEMSDGESCPVTVALRKLADYEDAEEQGLLLRLPCPVGTTVYNTTWWDSIEECVKVNGKPYFRTERKYKVSKSKPSIALSPT